MTDLHPSACVEWQWSKGRDGYGRKRYKGKIWQAPRFVYFRAHHPNDEAAMPQAVRHDCDNPGCVNIMHLRGGTLADNTRDMDKRGRRGATGPKPLNHGMPNQRTDRTAYHREKWRRQQAGTWNYLGDNDE